MIFGGQSEDAAKQAVAAQGEATDKEEYTGGRNMFTPRVTRTSPQFLLRSRAKDRGSTKT